MKGVRIYTRDGKDYASVKGIVTEVAEYNAKSIRFVAKTDTPFDEIGGFRATSIEEELNVGDELTFSCELGYLTGDATDDGKSANFLWSTSRGSASNLSDEILAALKEMKS